MIIQDGLKRMIENQEDVFYYITTMNENYSHPEMPEGAEEGIKKGLYRLIAAQKTENLHVQLIGSGTILQEVIAAKELLLKDFKVSSDLWSAPSFNELTRDGLDCERWNRMNPEKKPKIAYVTECLAETKGPVIVSTDYMKQYTEQVRQFVPNRYVVLGTDGFGRSDSRDKLRHFFEVDRYHITVAALKALVDDGELEAKVVTKAMKKYGLSGDKANPLSV